MPAIMFNDSSSALRWRPDDRLVTARETPLLDGLFAGRDTIMRSARRRSYRFELGAVVLGAEALRLQGRSGAWQVTSDTNRPRKSWAMGLTSEWAVDADNRLSLGLAAGTYRNLPSAGITTDPRATTSLKRLALTWARGEQWRLGLGWQQDGGSTRGASDRMVAIAGGAPIHEQGLRLSVAFLPGGTSDPHQDTFGFEARRATVSSADMAVIGSGLRQDMQGTLYFRRHF
ncbi:hypothetical protein KX816_07585 [Sphingosinicellaceae bacterium]|nr:hypothetical protein KX816_07585 [Sphingosinicellaceae bacterium]